MPADQVNLITVSEVVSGSFRRSVGASGTFYITAPVPGLEIADSP